MLSRVFRYVKKIYIWIERYQINHFRDRYKQKLLPTLQGSVQPPLEYHYLETIIFVEDIFCKFCGNSLRRLLFGSSDIQKSHLALLLKLTLTSLLQHGIFIKRMIIDIIFKNRFITE